MATRITPLLAHNTLPLHRHRQLLQAGSAVAGFLVFGLTGCATRSRTVSSAKGSTMFADVGSRTTRERNARGEGTRKLSDSLMHSHGSSGLNPVFRCRRPLRKNGHSSNYHYVRLRLNIDSPSKLLSKSMAKLRGKRSERNVVSIRWLGIQYAGLSTAPPPAHLWREASGAVDNPCAKPARFIAFLLCILMMRKRTSCSAFSDTDRSWQVSAGEGGHAPADYEYLD
jgi:hypothetical protein